jgi:hypothetical protein
MSRKVIWAVRDQPSCPHKRAFAVNGGKFIAKGKHDEQILMNHCRRGRSYDQTSIAGTREGLDASQ